MPKDYKTTVTVEHKTRGFEKVNQDNNRYIYALSKMRSQLSGLKRDYKDATREIDKLSKAIEKQNDAISKNMEKQQKRGAFVQGLAQGGFSPAMFLQRGPGMPQQMAGMAIGRTFRTGMAGAGGAFTGVQGLQQFLGSIPGVGGFLSGQIGKLAGYAEQNINYQRTKLGASPYLSTFSELLKERVARPKQLEGTIPEGIKTREEALSQLYARREMKTAQLRRKAMDSAQSRIDQRKAKEGILDTIYSSVSGEGIKQDLKIILEENKKADKQIIEYKKKSAKEYKDILKQYSDTKKSNEEAIRQSKKSSYKDPLSNLGGEGARLLGMNKEDTTRFLMEIIQAGGGVATGEQAKGIRKTAFAAKTLFGVQGGVSGAFLKAGRRGGLVGGTGNADNAFKQAINEGISLGLSGSEINQYLQQIAMGISQFQQTGIGINTDSISKLASDIARSGLPVTRALNIAQGITQYLQGIGSKGITSGADIMMLRELGGFKGGGVGEYRKARGTLEQLQFQAQGMGVEGIAGSPISGALQQYMQSVGGDQATKTEMLQRLLQRWGVKASVQQFDWLANTLMGGAAGGEQGKAINEYMKEQQSGAKELRRISKVGGLTEAAALTVSTRAPNLKAQVMMQNKQIDIGGKAAVTMQAFEQNALKVSGAFIKLADGPLKTVYEAMSSLTEISIKLAEQFTDMVKNGASVPW